MLPETSRKTSKSRFSSISRLVQRAGTSERKAHSHAFNPGWILARTHRCDCGRRVAVPLKKRKQFEMENIYIPSTLVMMLILPLMWLNWFCPSGQAMRLQACGRCGQV